MADGRGGAGRSIVIILVVVAVLAVIAFALGLFNVDTRGELKAPSIDVQATGGSVPKVDVDTADVDVGTTTETVKLPDVDVKTKEEQIKLPTVDVKPAGAHTGNTNNKSQSRARRAVGPAGRTGLQGRVRHRNPPANAAGA